MAKKSNKPYKKAYLEITNVCNLSCSFCPKTKRPPRFVSVEEFSRLLCQVQPFTDYVYLHLMGEPLLHPELGELLSLCDSHHLKVSLTTNGTLKLLGMKTDADEGAASEEDIRLMVENSGEQGAIAEDEQKWIENVFDFGDMVASDVMTPEPDVTAFS